MRTRSARVGLAALFTAGVLIVTACSQDPAPRPRSEPPAAATPPAVSSSAPEETPTAPAEGYRGRLPALPNPPFALPRKRYVKETIFELADAYVEEDELSYRRAVKVERMPAFYALRDDGAIDERSLAHSTLHRWHSLFFFLLETLREAQRLVRQKSATSSLFRRVFTPAPKKYRSEERREVLVRAQRTLWVEREYRSLFGRSVFPELATACAWR